MLLSGITASLLLCVCENRLCHPLYLKLQGANTSAEVIERIKEQTEFDYNFSQWKSLTLLCFKEERIIEVWTTRKNGVRQTVQTFPFTGFSGKIGPKLREGDRQIPEGIYRIEYLNPNSSFHLSMKVDYPNEFDRMKGESDGRKNLGYDIFIHGKSTTIGCIPIGDKNIEELFVMVSEIGISNVHVIISPYDMRKHEKEIDIPEINWEGELYERIESSLKPYVAQAAITM